MIFPEDYKVVGISRDFRPQDPIYFSTRYLISFQGESASARGIPSKSLSLYEIRSHAQGFMGRADEVELISSGERIAVYPDVVDTRDRAGLISLAVEACRGPVDTVIFTGPDEHVTFVHRPDPSVILELEVLDVSPPHPPWLVLVLKRLEESGIFGDLTVRFRPRILDLMEFHGPDVYYPCQASGLGRSLDAHRVESPGAVVVGCEVSREVFQATSPYPMERFINICPISGDLLHPQGPFITRCCRSERRGSVQKDGHQGWAVHWGDGAYQVEEAVRSLVTTLRRRDGI